MSSHVLSEVERVCDRIALLRKGELVLLAGLEAIRGLTARRVRVIFLRDVMVQPGRLPPGHEFLETAPRLWHLEVKGPLGPLLTALAGLPVADLEVREARLEDVLLKYYRDGSVAETPEPLHAPTLRRSDAIQPPP
jgi:ABC-2 type transport system ATP-binding protein